MLVLVILLLFASSAAAAPSINLPINAQVPPVAVAHQVYKFIFSESTFTSDEGPINYTLGNCPLWLYLDGPSRTFSGTPGLDGIGPGEAGSFVVDLIATDGAGSTTMPVTFVTTVDAGPGLGTPVAAQLPAFGAYSSPDTLVLTPGAALSLTFSPNTFTNTNAHTVYYAICANNTPLPSWVNFDPMSLTFSGIIPPATSSSELPQSFGIQLTASQVTGFAQSVTSFQLVIESHLFVFGNSLQIINTTTGSSVNFRGLQHDLTLDGQPVQQSDLAQVVTDAPSWLSLNNETLTLSGTAPPNAIQQNFTVTANDRFRHSASTVVLIQIAGNSSVALINPVATLNATIGTDFTFALNSSLPPTKAVNVTVDPGTASAWLEFNSTSFELYGHVPSNIKPQTNHFNITATRGGQSQSRIFDINVMCNATGCPLTSSHSGTPGQTAGATGASGTGNRGSKAWVAAAVILPLATLAGLLILLCCCYKRGWRLRLELLSKKTKKIMISRPIAGEKDGNTQAGADQCWDGINQERLSSEASGSPKIEWPPESKLNHKSRFRLSRYDSEVTNQSPRPDSWQNYVRKLDPSRPKHPKAVIDFSLPREESTIQTDDATDSSVQASPSANVIRLTDTNSSPTRGYLQHRKRASNMNYGGFGMFSSRPTSGFGHGRIGPSQGSSSLFFANRGIGHGDGGTPGAPPGWGIVRSSWRNLSRLSWTSTESSCNPNDLVVEEGVERPSTQKTFTSMLSSFPRPSTSNTLDVFIRPEVIHEASDDDAEPTILPPMKPLPRNPSKAKTRSPFRTKSSDKNEALQDFHRRRVQEKSHNPLFSAHISSSRKSSMQIVSTTADRQNDGDVMLEPVTPPKGTHLRSYSRSNSVEPPSLQSGPAQSSGASSSPQRKKSRIHYNLTIRALSPLRRSRSSYASTTSSSKFSDPVGVAPFYPHGALLEDTDAEGNKRWRHPNHPNPLGTNKTNPGNTTDVSDAELVDSLRAAGQFSAAQRLEYLRAQTEGRGDVAQVDNAIEVRSAKGRKLDHKPGLKSEDSENKSMKGDIGDAGGSSAFM